MPLKIVAILICTFSISYSINAQEFEKNGQPCVAEICIGDGIVELQKIEWDRAKNPFSDKNKPLYTSARKLSASEFKMLQKKFKGGLNASAPFLADGLFDSIALPELSKINVACEINQLIGTYTTKNGNPTRVGISLIPSKSDSSTQAWTVVQISRTFPTAVSEQQKHEIEAELTKRYFKFGAKNMNIKNPKPGESRYSQNFRKFGFNLNLFKGVNIANRLNSHPQCGGKEKINID